MSQLLWVVQHLGLKYSYIRVLSIITFQIKLVDVPEKNCFAKDGKGEICFRGAAVMKGYFNDEELTRETIDSEVRVSTMYWSFHL